MEDELLIAALAILLAALIALGDRIVALFKRTRQERLVSDREGGGLLYLETSCLVCSALLILLAMLMCVLGRVMWAPWAVLICAVLIALSWCCETPWYDVRLARRHGRKARRFLKDVSLTPATGRALECVVLALEANEPLEAVRHGRIALQEWARELGALAREEPIEPLILSDGEQTHWPTEVKRLRLRIQEQVPHDVLEDLLLESRESHESTTQEAAGRVFLRELWVQIVGNGCLPIELRRPDPKLGPEGTVASESG